MTLLQSSKSQLPLISEALSVFGLEEDTDDARDIHQASSASVTLAVRNILPCEVSCVLLLGSNIAMSALKLTQVFRCSPLVRLDSRP